MIHGKTTEQQGIHSVIAYRYADAAARTGAVGFTYEDVGKVALQIDDSSYWVLASVTPTWTRLSTGTVSFSALTADYGFLIGCSQNWGYGNDSTGQPKHSFYHINPLSRQYGPHAAVRSAGNIGTSGPGGLGFCLHYAYDAAHPSRVSVIDLYSGAELYTYTQVIAGDQTQPCGACYGEGYFVGAVSGAWDNTYYLHWVNATTFATTTSYFQNPPYLNGWGWQAAAYGMGWFAFGGRCAAGTCIDMVPASARNAAIINPTSVPTLRHIVLPASGQVSCLTYGGGKFACTQQSTSSVALIDASTGTVQHVATSGTMSPVAYAGGYFYSSEGGTGMICRIAPDGTITKFYNPLGTATYDWVAANYKQDTIIWKFTNNSNAYTMYADSFSSGGRWQVDALAGMATTAWCVAPFIP